MRSALSKDTWREITHSLARFLAVTMIVALGVAFFCGIKATGPSMQKTAEQYFEDTQLADYRLVSTIGFTDEDVQAVAATEGVSAAAPAYFADLLMTNQDTQRTVHVMSLPAEGQPDQPVLDEGRLPTAKDECLMDGKLLLNTVQLGIGDTVTFTSPDEKDSPIADTLNTQTFTIVGSVHSSQYISYERGKTTVGDGSIYCYFIVPPEAFSYERYTQINVVAQVSAQGVSAYDTAYADAIAALTPRLEATADLRVIANMQEIRSDAQAKLDDANKELADAQAEYDEKIADAQKELADARQELADGEDEYTTAKKSYKNQIASAEQKLEDAATEIAQGKKELAANKAAYQKLLKETPGQLEAAQQQIDAGWAQVNAAQEELEETLAPLEAQLQAGWDAYHAAYAKYEVSYAEYQKSAAQLKEAIAQRDALAVQIASLKQQLQEAEQADPPDPERIAALTAQLKAAQGAYAELEAQIEAAQPQVAAAKKELAAVKKELDATYAELSASQKELDAQRESAQSEIDASKKKLNASQSELDENKAAFAQAKATVPGQLAAAQQQLDDAQGELAQGKQDLQSAKQTGQAQLDDVREQLDQGYVDLAEGESELADKTAEGESELSSARQSIADAQHQLDTLSNGEWYVYNRDKNPGYSGYNSDTQRIEAVGTIFPVFFLLVAALVCLTTMTRMVEEQRTQIGTLKALGYSSVRIASKFCVYGAVSAIIGSILGIVAGLSILPPVIYSAYDIIYTTTDHLTIQVPWATCLLAGLIALLCTTFTTMVALKSVLNKAPATLMRPKAPKPGKRIFLERVTLLWNRLGFISKVTARNLFRYKARFAMTVVGIAGCTALILAAFALQDAIYTMIPRQFEDLQKYDTVISFLEEGDAEQKTDFLQDFSQDDRFADHMLCRYMTVDVVNDSVAKDLSLYLVVPDDPSTLGNFVQLRTRVGHTPLAPTDQGAILTEKLASTQGLSVGDTLVVRDGDAQLSIPIVGISENYLGHYVYLTPALYQQLAGQPADYNTTLATPAEGYADDEDTRTEIAKNWMDRYDIVVTYTASLEANANDMIKSLRTVILVMILSAGALCFVVLYNLTNINITERVREIATIKVLGFFNREVYNYIYRENIILSIVGIACGLVAGVFLSNFIITTAEVDTVMFARDIAPLSFLYSAGLTAAFTLLANYLTSPRLRKISMVESLKSVE